MSVATTHPLSAPPLAHTRKTDEVGQPQGLIEHLHHVADRTAEFLPGNWSSTGWVAGLWHDCGKYQPAFQRYIRSDAEASNKTSPKGVPHAIVGAALALEALRETDAALVVAQVIEAHHGALKFFGGVYSAVQERGNRLLADARAGGLPAELAAARPATMGKVTALAIRMVFSALIDADLLDTEAWDRGSERQVPRATLVKLRDLLDGVCRAKIAVSEADAVTEPERLLAALRRQVYESCVAAGEDSSAPPAAQWTLTVPTGGGKTLSGLAFALHHAVRTGARRVIVVAPYTSILEQTADVYREALGAENVVEHHSNLSPAADTDRNRQACENWDAAVVVTTSVQFLESLHAAHKRPCRKLHRIANSVVLLDEVQTFPAGLLKPIHSMLARLVADWGVTVVHGTATQPLLAAATEPTPTRGLPTMVAREIMPDVSSLFAAVRGRFRVEAPWGVTDPLDPRVLAEEVRAQRSALVITHRRDDARYLAELLGEGCLHLSAAMCAAHRTAVLNEVRRRLFVGEPCWLVATQLVEAGVDLDFPVVYRALAGLETLAQAAGRCNRAMRLREPGRFVVYCAGSEPGLDDEGVVVRESRPPQGTPQLGMKVARVEFAKGLPDLNDPELFPRFSRTVLTMCETDRKGIATMEAEMNFPEVAEAFRMIDERLHSVVVPFGDAPALVEQLRKEGPSRDRYRALQRYVVGVRRHMLDELHRGGWLNPALRNDVIGDDTLWVLEGGDGAPYDKRFGLVTKASQMKLRSQIV